VTFHAPGDVRVEEVPDPEPVASDDAVVRVEATGICGSDLHIYHGRVAIEPGFGIGHEYVGTLGSLQGTQAELVLVPNANLTLRSVPDGLSDEVALFAGDVAGTAYHAICGDAARPDPLEPGAAVAIMGLGPVGLCAVQVAKASGASLIVAVDSVEDRLGMAESFGAKAVHLTEEDPRARVKELTGGRGVDLAVDAVGHPEALDLACRLARKAGTVSVIGVYAERAEVHMGVVWIKALSWRTGHANVIGHLDRVLAMLSAGVLDPGPLVTHRMSLDAAPEAYAIYDRREALKIVLRP
jgi:2-desacetyl-2-hydroxyethyl bacteriochlorophyllide A dehydrogenase